jgi:hypothetical protein
VVAIPANTSRLVNVDSNGDIHMAKAISFFSGYDSTMRAVHLAVRDDGTQFFRSVMRTRWGAKWSAWTVVRTPVSFSEDGSFCEWGFKTLYAAPAGTFEKTRLPS